MIPWQFEVTRFWSLGAVIAQRLELEQPPEVRIEHGRTTLIFRRMGGTRWPEADQVEYAFRIAAIARVVLADDKKRGKVRRAAKRAMVVVYEDSTLVRGCAVVARWECVVPVASSV